MTSEFMAENDYGKLFYCAGALRLKYGSRIILLQSRAFLRK